jgi:hypothetical protein
MDSATLTRLVPLLVLAAGVVACWWGAYLGWRHALRGGNSLPDRLLALVYMLVCAVLGAAFTWMASLLIAFAGE